MFKLFLKIVTKDAANRAPTFKAVYSNCGCVGCLIGVKRDLKITKLILLSSTKKNTAL